ncbi:MAG: hypothetical protein WDW38_010501 [Sanguina aurantia]
MCLDPPLLPQLPIGGRSIIARLASVKSDSVGLRPLWPRHQLCTRIAVASHRERHLRRGSRRVADLVDRLVPLSHEQAVPPLLGLTNEWLCCSARLPSGCVLGAHRLPSVKRMAVMSAGAGVQHPLHPWTHRRRRLAAPCPPCHTASGPGALCSQTSHRRHPPLRSHPTPRSLPVRCLRVSHT